MIASIYAGFIGAGLLYIVKRLYDSFVKDKSEWDRLRSRFERFRATVMWAALSLLIVGGSTYVLAMLFNEADRETIDFFFPIVMGYLAFFALGLPIILWILEKVWHLYTRLTGKYWLE